MQITFLGTAGAVPLRTRNYSSLFIEHNTVMCLLDCGEGSSRQLRTAGLPLDNIEYFYLTHAHLDHILGIPNILLSKYVNNRKSPTTIRLPKEGIPILNGVLKTIPERILSDMIIEIEGLKPGNTHALKDNFTIKCARTDHDPEISYASLAYRVDVSGKAIVYTGDTKPCLSVEQLSQKVDVLITEATFPDDLQETAARTGHTTPCQAAQLAVNSQVQRLVLTHVSWEENEEPPNLLRQAHKVFKGPITVAHDMLQISV